MRVLHITNNYPTKKEPDYGVFTKDQIDNVKLEGVESHLLFINAKENGIKEYFKAIKKIKAIYKEYDIIHCFHGLTLIIAFLTTKNKPILISFLNEIKYENFKKNKYINKIYIFIYNYILKSKRVFSIFKDKLPDERKMDGRSFHLPNGVNLQEFYPISKNKACELLGLDKSRNYILFVSSKNKMRSQKRYDIFTATIDILKKDYSEYNIEELVMSGVPRKNSLYYYNTASVHLLASDYEGSPNSVKEAMSCNIPIVSTDVGNVKEMLLGANNCFVSIQEPRVLAKNIIKAIISPTYDLRSVLIKNELTVQDKTSELIRIYNQINRKFNDIKK